MILAARKAAAERDDGVEAGVEEMADDKVDEKPPPYGGDDGEHFLHSGLQSPYRADSRNTADPACTNDTETTRICLYIRHQCTAKGSAAPGTITNRGLLTYNAACRFSPHEISVQDGRATVCTAFFCRRASCPRNRPRQPDGSTAVSPPLPSAISAFSSRGRSFPLPARGCRGRRSSGWCTR